MSSAILMLPVHLRPSEEEKREDAQRKSSVQLSPQVVSVLGEGGGLYPSASSSPGNWGLHYPEIEEWHVPRMSHQVPQEELEPHSGPGLKLPDRRPLGPLSLGLLV